MFLFIYILYIVFVVNHDKNERAKKAKQQWLFNEMKDTTFKRMNRSEFLNLMDDENAYYQGITPSGDISGTSSVIYEGHEINPEEMLHFSIESASKIDEQRTENQMKRLTNEYKESSWANAKHVIFKATKTNEDKYKQISFIQYILSYVQIRRITIPMTNSDNWNRNLDSLTPFCSVLFFLLVSDLFDPLSPIQIITLSCAFSLSVIMRFNTYHSEPPSTPFTGILIFYAFVMSIVWIWMLANLVVDLITIYGDLMGISSTFLAVTLLAVGNCIGDVVASYSISGKGYGGMAMTG